MVDPQLPTPQKQPNLPAGTPPATLPSAPHTASLPLGKIVGQSSVQSGDIPVKSTASMGAPANNTATPAVSPAPLTSSAHTSAPAPVAQPAVPVPAAVPLASVPQSVPTSKLPDISGGPMSATMNNSSDPLKELEKDLAALRAQASPPQSTGGLPSVSPVTPRIPALASTPIQPSSVPPMPPKAAPVAVSAPVTSASFPSAPVFSAQPVSSPVAPTLNPALTAAPRPTSPPPGVSNLPTSPTQQGMTPAMPIKPPMQATNMPGFGTPPPAMPPVGGSGTPPVTPPTAPVPAKPKRSILRFLPLVLILLALFGILGGAAWWFFGRPTEEVSVDSSPRPQQRQVELAYWGLWEPSTVMQEVFSEYENQNPGIKITYTQQTPTEYRERLQTAIASGQGPDLFRYHASWVPMLRTELSPLPQKVMSKEEFAETFYPVATQQLTLNQEIVGVPLMYDGLALYYNVDILEVANKTPAADWETLRTDAEDLTIRAGDKITRAGIALGTAENVEHFSDILGVMMLQNGATMNQPTSQEVVDAVTFYKSFAEDSQVWDNTFPNATVAFGRGDVAMMIAPSWRAHEIKAANPNLRFEIAPLPQLPATEPVNWASYWAEGVSAKSARKEEAWKLLAYLSSADVQKRFYSEASKVRAFGEIYSRQDLASELLESEYVGAYLEGASSAQGWYLNGFTHDNGVNDRIIKYYKDAVNATTAVNKSLETVALGVQQVLQQYGLPMAPPLPTAEPVFQPAP